MRSSSVFRRVQEAAEVVARGGVVVYPTDTVYGIGCNPFDAKAVERVMVIKRRENKPSPVLVSDFDQVYSVAKPKDEEVEACLRLWPGPVTVVMEKRPELPLEVTAGMPTVGVRMPANAIALSLMQKSALPLVGTSANISGRPPAVSLDLVEPEIIRMADLAIDGGRTLYGRPSTVVELVGGELRVVREGAWSIEEIKKRLEG
ncbi:MAG: L-threonylcarbamoyladenylate synthase [Candidatus Caldarchaeum sp.]|nr:L-threonylcarbamoyladenylate synthase [Candidatus Caldarchaeum sp.]MCS7137789.1 L-threonylcarbamoyladenylate synthase [Candidatus Caldarchaeum sp.]